MGMEFQLSRDMLFSDTPVPDVFIYDIMPSLPSDCVKVYIFGLYMCKCNKSITLDDFAKARHVKGRVKCRPCSS